MMVVSKGAFLNLAQNEVSLLVKAGFTAFVAGTLLKRNSDGQWEVASASDAGDATHVGAELYMAIVGSANLTARNAGGQSGNTPVGEETPKIPALSTAGERTVFTNCVDDVETYSIGDKLTVGADGKFVPHTNGKTVYAEVTLPAFTYNDATAVAVAGYRTGLPVRVIEIRTRFHPQVAA